MKVEKKELPKSSVELTVELTVEEFAPFIEKGAKKISQDIKIDGFRAGNVPIDVLKQKVGEMSILEESARIAISASLEKIIKKNIEGEPVGQPKVDITKLAPKNPLGFKVVLAMIPDITLGSYKDLKIKQKETKLDKDQVDKAMNDLREMRVKEIASTEAVKEGDKVLVDMQMFLDNVPVEGGQGKDTAIVIGKDYIVPGFDKNLLGMKKGETKEFKLPYPKEYHMKNLAGKMVDFKITAKDVFTRELPELNDEFAQGLGLKKIDELKANIEKNMKEGKEKENNQMAEKEMLETVVKKTKFGDIPEMLIEHEVNTMLHELEHTVTEQGGKFEDYLTSIKKTREQLMLDVMPDAITRVKVSLVVRAVAKQEKIKVEDAEIKKHIDEMKVHYAGDKSKEKEDILKRLDTADYKHYAINVLTSRKVVDALREWNIVK